MPAGAPARFGGSTGYRLKNADSAYEAGYYADTKRVKFDFQDATLLVKRGVVVAMQDALRHEAQITLDAYWYLPVSVKDAAGLETKAKYNYRTLQPHVVTDPNDNQTHFRYTPIGLVEKVWLESNDGQGGSEAKPELQYDYDFLSLSALGLWIAAAHLCSHDSTSLPDHVSSQVFHIPMRHRVARILRWFWTPDPKAHPGRGYDFRRDG